MALSREDEPMFWTSLTPGIPPAGQDSEGLRRNFGVHELSRGAMFLASVQEILRHDLGFAESARTGAGVLGDGEPIPLMSYAMIEYLMGLDLSDFAVLELGGGQSTLFWARRTASVRTIEHDRAWIESVSRSAPPNVTIIAVEREQYVQRARSLEGEFDAIVIDCGANRFECARAVVDKLRAGGMIILDNSDWYPNTARLLREHDLIQVDYPDFRPAHHYRGTSSLFLHPDFRPRARGDRLPPPALGGKDVAETSGWDRPDG